MIPFAVMLGALLALALAGVRAVIGPTLQDRALAAYAIVEKVVLFCAAAAAAGASATWIDAAFALMLSGYITTVAIQKTLRFGNLQPPLARTQGER
ncbi:MAG: monovalent cation/H+ antiporter complex subunit F [Terricaulis sp.]